MKHLIKYLRPFYKMMLWGLFLKATGTLVELALPYILGYVLDGIDKKQITTTWQVLVWGGIMLLCTALALVCNIVGNRKAGKVARDFTENLRHDLFNKTMNLSPKQIDTFTVPSLESRLTSDTYNLHHFVTWGQRMGVRAPILLTGGLIIVLMTEPKLVLIMIPLMIFIAFAVILISRLGVPLYRKVQAKVDGMTRIVREDAQGIRVIKALSKTEYEKERYDKANKDLRRFEERVGIILALSNPIMNAFFFMGIVAVIIFGAYLINAGSFSDGKITSYIQYFTIIINSLLSVTSLFRMYTKSSASASRINEVLNAPDDMPVLEKPDTDRKGYIVFDHVYFSYNGKKDDLSDIDFCLEKGQTLGIIGATGSGKTTIMKLLMRFYDVDKGGVYIGGKDVRSIPPDILHTMFGASMQNDFIYNDTIRENVSFGRDVCDEDVIKATKTAQAYDYIQEKENAFLHELNFKGANISGGQKQRLLISRALVGNPEILILDDSSSALDYKTDANLRQAIEKNYEGITKIVIAQRVSSVKNSDLILVIDEGKIISRGTHEQLLQTSTVYREIHESQMGGDFGE